MLGIDGYVQQLAEGVLIVLILQLPKAQGRKSIEQMIYTAARIPWAAVVCYNPVRE